MLNRLRNNFGLKALSIGLAVVAWAYFHLAAAPGTTARFDQTLTVPIVVTGVRPGYQATATEKFATVVVDVPRNGDSYHADQFRAVADAADLVDPGFHTVSIRVVPPGVARSFSPPTVLVSLDRIEERPLPVGLNYLGDAHGVVVESASVVPPATLLSGAATTLDHITGVAVQIPIPREPQDFDKMVRPMAVDAEGHEVQAVQITPNLVRVHVRFVAVHG